MKNLFKFLLCALIATTAFVSCSTDDGSGQTANLSVKLVDAPGEYAQVLIDVQGVEVIVDGDPIQLDTNTGVYDLLTLTGGEFASLVNENIPAGRLSQMRLILGNNNTVILNDEAGTTADLKTPSAQQSGLKLNVHYDLEPGLSYEFILDFNVHESIVKLGAAQGYILKPVIRVTTEAESGAISGAVSPAVAASVTATDGETTVTANTDPETGEFLLYGVPEGSYVVLIEPAEESGLGEVSIPDVSVTTGVTTDLGAIELQ